MDPIGCIEHVDERATKCYHLPEEACRAEYTLRHSFVWLWRDQ